MILCQRSVILAALIAATAPAAASAAEIACTGHQLLSASRPETSCLTVTPDVYVSPDRAVHAVVLPSDVDLNATPDMESRVVFRTADGKLLTSQDYSSPRGSNGYYVVGAKWSPDSQFFVFSLSSSGGHSPWSFPMWVYSRQSNAVVSFSAMIADNPTLSGDFQFVGPHTVSAVTWKTAGSDQQVPVSVDLAAAVAKLAATAK